MKAERLQADGATVILFEFDPVLDHAQVLAMAQAVDDAIERDGELRLLLDLSRTETFALGAFLSPKGFLTSIRSIGPVSRYAVVGAPSIAAAAVENFGAILPLKSRAFKPADIAEARRWVCGFPGS